MKCPKCGSGKCRYVEQRNVVIRKKLKRNKRKNKNQSKPTSHGKLPPRTNFDAKCRACGWKGVI